MLKSNNEPMAAKQTYDKLAGMQRSLAGDSLVFSLAFIAETCDEWVMAYTGGKGRAFRSIISRMPPHEVYIETHLGSGAVMRHKRPARLSIGVDIDHRVLRAFAREPSSAELINGDAADFLATFPFAGDELVYADPPYWPAARRRGRCYPHDYSASDHLHLLGVLLSLRCAVMLSGYRCEAYDERLSGWTRHDFEAVSQTGLVEESLWMNFEPGCDLHDYRYIGADFREREALSRRRRTQIRKLQQLSALERRAVLSDLAQSFPDDFRAASRFCDP